MPTNSTPASTPSSTTHLQIEVRSFERSTKDGPLVGSFEIVINGRQIIRDVKYFIPNDNRKPAFVKWPAKKVNGPHGDEWVPYIQWVDRPSDFRFRAYVTKAIETYLETRKPAGPPKADIPNEPPR